MPQPSTTRRTPKYHTTLDRIKDHLKRSEGEPEYPYLDIKGNVTIGVGFMTKNEDDFAKLGL